ncbi:ATP-binding protein [Micromonospora aurantiaca]|uniref:HD domain-containing protein n=1 Tax=Micromonospora aurantiaca (nom. illeg.) TaxID=47850 RepID=UPI0033C57091
METELRFNPERLASEAAGLEAFGSLNLLYIKRQVYELMRHIGEGGIFETYTRHDSQHIESMLGLLDWIIPEETARKLQPADWLLIVLSIYLHDLGMLVTRDEFAQRECSSFPAFRERQLLTKDAAGRDYSEKIQQLSAEEAERFLYEEFVRFHHASRIRGWIEGDQLIQLGKAQSAAREISALLVSLDDTFRRDLALVCESHHLNDLDNVEKYRVRQPYGTSPKEVANVQYAALVLRTVDLLQIARDRAPSIAFRILNPSDPLSQTEWSKQTAVRAVLPQPRKNRDGDVDLNLPPHTIEIHATFSREDGFFALTNYLAYARKQLEQSFKWATESQKRHGSRFTFPWRDIDETTIITKGFLPKQFQFGIDQERILDLLTGHTLYNDSSVVLRELAQNAIDAVRLQYATPTGRASKSSEGKVEVRWVSASRMLEIRDNGTGMTQEIVERNFLKAGASRYQDPAFKDQFPDFNPISRFGIGVLSAFMVADSVEVLTSHPGDAEARKVSLRSVHGKYLIRLYKKSDPEVASLGGHGTLVRLVLRASAEVGDVLRLARHWFVLPGCRLTVAIDNDAPIPVGFSSVRQAMLSRLEEMKLSKDDRIEVREFNHSGVDVAYAVRWSPYFRVWEFIQDPERGRVGPEIGECIEGIRVKDTSPGFSDRIIWALANASGATAPRTNVARSDIESTPEYQDMLRAIYAAYCNHIEREVIDCEEKRGFSSTKAVAEAHFLSSPILARQAQLAVKGMPLLEEEMRKLPILVVEEGERRSRTSIHELSARERFFTIQDPLTRRAESLVRELSINTSVGHVIKAVSGAEIALPDGPILVAGKDGNFGSFLRREFKPSCMSGDANKARLQFEWRKSSEAPRWRETEVGSRLRPNRFPDLYEHLPNLSRMGYRGAGSHWSARGSRILFPSDDLVVDGLDAFDAVTADGCTYMLPGRSWVSLFGESGLEGVTKSSNELLELRGSICLSLLTVDGLNSDVREYYLKAARRVWDSVAQYLHFDVIRASVQSGNWRVFDMVTLSGQRMEL